MTSPRAALSPGGNPFPLEDQNRWAALRRSGRRWRVVPAPNAGACGAFQAARGMAGEDFRPRRTRCAISALVFAYPPTAETGEALPVAPLEAMAHGCAPFVSNLPCCRDYIPDSVTGLSLITAAPSRKTLAHRLAELIELGIEQIGQIGSGARKLLSAM